MNSPLLKLSAKAVIALALIFTSYTAIADCGSSPNPPEALEETQLNYDELTALDTEMKTHLEQVETYVGCLDGAIGTLAPADADEAYYESAGYQADFDALRNLITAAETQKTTTIERHNYLLENVATQQSN